MALTAFASTRPLVAMYGDGQRRWRRRGGDVLGDLRRHGGDGGDLYLAVSVHLLFFSFLFCPLYGLKRRKTKYKPFY